MQKAMFYNAKDGLLECQRPSFTVEFASPCISRRYKRYRDGRLFTADKVDGGCAPCRLTIFILRFCRVSAEMGNFALCRMYGGKMLAL